LQASSQSAFQLSITLHFALSVPCRGISDLEGIHLPLFNLHIQADLLPSARGVGTLFLLESSALVDSGFVTFPPIIGFGLFFPLSPQGLLPLRDQHGVFSLFCFCLSVLHVSRRTVPLCGTCHSRQTWFVSFFFRQEMSDEPAPEFFYFSCGVSFSDLATPLPRRLSNPHRFRFSPCMSKAGTLSRCSFVRSFLLCVKEEEEEEQKAVSRGGGFSQPGHPGSVFVFACFLFTRRY